MTIVWHRIPAPVVALLRRLKNIEHADGSWPGGDAVAEVERWLVEHGVDPDMPADRLPAADDQPHVYERLVLVRTSCPWPLEVADLDHAIEAAVTGTAVRVEHADSSETFWTELEVVDVGLAPNAAP